MKQYLIAFFLLMATAFVRGQETSDVAALKQTIASGTEDTAKVGTLLSLTSKVSTDNFKLALQGAQKALDLSVKLNYTKGRAGAYSCFADAYWFHSDFEKAQENYFKSYRIYDSIGDERGVALALYNIGWILVVQQKSFKEMGYLYRSQQGFEHTKDTAGLLQVYNAIGSGYNKVYIKEHQKPYFDSALKYFNKGITIGEAGKSPNNVARIYGNMSDLFAESGDYNSSLFYIDKSMEMLLKANDSTFYMMAKLIRSKFLFELKRFKESKVILEEGLQYARTKDLHEMMLSALHGLASCNYELGDYKQAFRELESYVTENEQMEKEKYSTSVKELQGKYNLEKTEASLKELKQTSEIQELKNRQNGYFIFILLGVAGIVIVVAGLLFRQNKLKNQANVQLQAQNRIISEKKKEIDNSINYAKGIQNAVLPDLNELKKLCPASFVFYLPKDVVSGDFYWFSEVNSSEPGVRSDQQNSQPSTSNSQLILAAADCTGHGVPGALMSIVSMDKLNQAVFEKKLSDPSRILQFLNVEIKKALKQHSDESKQKDGLDIALLKIDRDKKKVWFSGANRPLYLVRNKEVTEFKADKVAIAGFTPNEHAFALQEIDLEANDCLYLFSDGYADQFGGDSGKKFMTKSLKALLASISDKAIDGQERAVVDSHRQWKGNYEQVDDILVIGIKI